MGTPEVVKPHSIWVLEHRLCPGMSPYFRCVATRVATRLPLISRGRQIRRSEKFN